MVSHLPLTIGDVKITDDKFTVQALSATNNVGEPDIDITVFAVVDTDADAGANTVKDVYLTRADADAHAGRLNGEVQRFIDAVHSAVAAADGDSSDSEIERLQAALDQACAIIVGRDLYEVAQRAAESDGK